MTSKQRKVLDDLLIECGYSEGQEYPTIVSWAFEAGLAAAKPVMHTKPGSYSIEVRTEAASIALLAADHHPMKEEAGAQTSSTYVEIIEILIAERLHALERTTIEQTAERLIEAVRMEAAR